LFIGEMENWSIFSDPVSATTKAVLRPTFLWIEMKAVCQIFAMVLATFGDDL